MCCGNPEEYETHSAGEIREGFLEEGYSWTEYLGMRRNSLEHSPPVTSQGWHRMEVTVPLSPGPSAGKPRCGRGPEVTMLALGEPCGLTGTAWWAGCFLLFYWDCPQGEEQGLQTDDGQYGRQSWKVNQMEEWVRKSYRTVGRSGK